MKSSLLKQNEGEKEKAKFLSLECQKRPHSTVELYTECMWNVHGLRVYWPTLCVSGLNTLCDMRDLSK